MNDLQKQTVLKVFGCCRCLNLAYKPNQLGFLIAYRLDGLCQLVSRTAQLDGQLDC